MLGPAFIKRWVLSPYEKLEHPDGTSNEQPVAAEYAQQHPIVPRILDARSLCLCEFTAQGWIAARQDPRLIVLDSISSAGPIPAAAAQELASYGVTSAMRVHEMLMQMYTSLGDVAYLPAF